MRTVWFTLLLLPACGLRDAPGGVVVEAHRAGAAHFPENSRTAIQGALDAGWEGIEFDVVLTADDQPIIHHDPWMSSPLCAHADGTPIAERIPVHELTLEEVQTGFVCGGTADPEFPDALVVAEAPISFDWVITRIRERNALLAFGPYPLIHIDVKYEPGITPPPEAFADAILTRWVSAQLPNTWYASANTPELIGAFETWGEIAGADVPTSLIWPRFPPDEGTLAIGLGNEFSTMAGTQNLVRVIEEAGADGIAITHRIADRRRVEEVAAEGYDVALWTINDPGQAKRYAKWPISSLITDDPEILP